MHHDATKRKGTWHAREGGEFCLLFDMRRPSETVCFMSGVYELQVSPSKISPLVEVNKQQISLDAIKYAVMALGKCSNGYWLHKLNESVDPALHAFGKGLNVSSVLAKPVPGRALGMSAPTGILRRRHLTVLVCNLISSTMAYA